MGTESLVYESLLPSEELLNTIRMDLYHSEKTGYFVIRNFLEERLFTLYRPRDIGIASNNVVTAPGGNNCVGGRHIRSTVSMPSRSSPVFRVRAVMSHSLKRLI